MTNKPAIPPEPQKTLLERVHDLLWVSGEPQDYVDMLSSDAIKHLFDWVRNYLIIAGLAFGWLAAYQYSTTRAHQMVAQTIVVLSYVVLLFGIHLAILNSFFFINLISKTRFIQSRRYPFYWLIPVLVVNVLLGFLILLLAYMGRQSPSI